MRPEDVALTIMWMIWALAVLAIGIDILVSRRRERRGREHRINLAPETTALFKE